MTATMVVRTPLALAVLGLSCLGWSQIGTVSAFGGNFAGALGDGTTTHRFSPVAMIGLSGIEALACGSEFSLALDSAGDVWSSGWNSAGQLGDGSYSDRWIAVKSGMGQAMAIAAGAAHSMALRRDGTVFAWGANAYHQLGRSSSEVWNTNLPLQVPGLTNIVAIAGGGTHSLALDRRGRVWSWGGNSYGQLGDGTNAHRAGPALLGLNRVVAIAAGEYHSLALTADGKVWGWGRNSSGQLGDGTQVDRWVPTQVAGLTDAVGISAMAGTSMALLTDRTVVGWGSDYNAELAGLGDHNTPVAIPGLDSVTFLDSGWYHGAVRRSNGTVWTWGNNQYGALGRTTNFPVPTPVSGLSGVGYVSGGQYHTLALHRPVTDVSGTVNLDGYTGPGAIRVAIEPVGQSIPVQIRGFRTLLGDFSVSFWHEGQYTLVISGNHHLARRFGPFNFDGTPVSGLSFTLTNGDITSDNTINVQDFLALRNSFGSSGGGGTWNANADLNGDGSVGVADFLVLRRNFGRSGD